MIDAQVGDRACAQLASMASAMTEVTGVVLIHFAPARRRDYFASNARFAREG
jgi:hypothetical protein